MTDAIIHLRVPPATKGRWVRASRAAGQRLTNYITTAVEALQPRARDSMMTDEQFAALAELLTLRGGSSQEAARLVLVEGMQPSAAARQAGTTPQAASNALARCRRGLGLARMAAGTGD